MRFSVLFLAACSFPQPALNIDAADPDASKDGDAALAACPPSGCQLWAVEPTIANTGDTLMLEGAFAETMTVTFPGGATATATVFGANRASVVVPADAGSGPLSVTNGETTVGAIEFRHATFTLGMNTFQLFDDQSNGARPMSRLVVRRNSNDQQTLVRNGFVYMFGGNNAARGGRLATIERAAIHRDGSLGPFSVLPTTMLQPRDNGSVVGIGRFVYAIGGDAGDTIERAVIEADGTLGAFESVGVLPAKRFRFSTAVVGTFVYLLGGTNGSTHTSAVLRASIGADGDLGPFQEAGLDLAAPHNNAYAKVIGRFLYVIGGVTTGVDAAEINDDGTLGAFAVVKNLNVVRTSAPLFVAAGRLFVVGGPGLSSIESAAISPNGSLGDFTLSSNASLTITHGGGAFIAGDHAYLIGGSDAIEGQTRTIQRASLNASGELATFSAAAGTTLSTARAIQSTAVLRDRVLVLGGGGSAGRLSSIEQATLELDGSLGAVTTASTSLPTPTQAAGTAVIGNSVHLIGGNPQGVFTTAVVRATLGATALGAFSSSPPLVTGRANPMVAVAGSQVYVMGGHNGTPFGSVERATIGASDSIGAFTTVAGVTLAVPRFNACVVIHRKKLFVIGGSTPAAIASIESASLSNDGTLSTFALLGTSLTTPRAGHACKVIGNSLYVFGGTTSTFIERARLNDDGTLGVFSAVSGIAMFAALSNFSHVATGGFVHTLGGEPFASGITDTSTRAALP